MSFPQAPREVLTPYLLDLATGSTMSDWLRINCSIQLERLRPSDSALARAQSSKSLRKEMLVWVLPGARCPCRVLFLVLILYVYGEEWIGNKLDSRK